MFCFFFFFFYMVIKFISLQASKPQQMTRKNVPFRIHSPSDVKGRFRSLRTSYRDVLNNLPRCGHHAALLASFCNCFHTFTSKNRNNRNYFVSEKV
uniref:Putative secreted protein n=1 Tax=Rhipicephalus microplus TaxID=6941 RepID=A0A6M2D9Z8_RHIMP